MDHACGKCGISKPVLDEPKCHTLDCPSGPVDNRRSFAV